MTVGIFGTNGQFAAVVSDARVSGMGRESDRVEKTVTFNQEGAYHGALIVTGNANSALGVLNRMENYHGDTLEDFAGSISSQTGQRQINRFASTANRNRFDIETRSLLVSEQEKQAFKVRETEKANDSIYQMQQNAASEVKFLTTAYDLKAGRVRVLTVDPIFVEEDFEDFRPIGSGLDGAGVYLANHTPSKGSDLEPHQVAYIVMHAFASANINVGVGGAPKIALVDREGVQTLPNEKAITLLNASNVNLTRIREDEFMDVDAMAVFDEVLNSPNPDYQSIADAVGMSKEELTQVCVPREDLQRIANSHLFSVRSQYNS